MWTVIAVTRDGWDIVVLDGMWAIDFEDNGLTFFGPDEEPLIYER